MSSIAFDYNSAVAVSVGRFVSRMPLAIYRSIADYFARLRAEKTLTDMQDYLLDDIGICRADIHMAVRGQRR